MKPLAVSLVHIITGPLFIPGGALAGGLYMMWLVLGAGMLKKPGSASLIGLVQAVMVLALGIFGSHGVFSFLTYTLPGVGVDLVLLLPGINAEDKIAMFLAGIAANITGVVLTNLIFFRLPFLPFLLSLSLGAFSGAIGGLIAYKIKEQLEKLKV